MPLLLIFLSYSLSFFSALKIRFSKSSLKAFSTWSSHFIVGKFFFETAMFIPSCLLLCRLKSDTGRLSWG